MRTKVDPKEKEFNRFIQSAMNHMETIESYISSAIKEGKTRREAISELHRMGVYLSDIKKS